MNASELFEAVGEIDSDLIARCETERVHNRRPGWLGPAVAAACLFAAVLCVLLFPPSSRTESPPAEPGVELGDDPATDAPPAASGFSITLNELKKEPSSTAAMISLNQEDFVPMTDAELLDYYGAVLNIEQAVPGFKLQPQNPKAFNGVFKTEARGVYFDMHSFVFLSEDGRQRIDISLEKKFRYPMLPFEKDVFDRPPAESEINGMGVTVFSYTDSEGNRCYHTEFRGGETSYSVTSYNVSRENYAAALASLIADNFVSDGAPAGAGAPHTMEGTVDVVDSVGNRIGVKPSDGGESAGFMVYLPDGEAQKYSPGDRVKIAFRGNPMTVDTIWRQQLTSVSLENG